MTRDQKIQAITKAIQEAVPDVMELKLGCKVEAEFYSLNPNISETWTEVLTLNGNHQNSRWYHFIETDAQSETIVKILGSPIGIREILLWMNIVTKLNFLLHSDSTIYEDLWKNIQYVAYYNQEQDTLEHQSDELIDILYPLTQS